MRGFPLVNTLVVLAFFALAWFPLSRLTGDSKQEAGPLNEGQEALQPDVNEVVESGGVTLRVFSTHDLKQLKVEYLGKTVMSLGEAGQSTELEQKVEGVELVPEGIEFWVDARFSDVADSQRAAVGIEAVPDNPEIESIQVTLWGRAGESYVGDLAVFQWPKITEDGK